ncbi:MULTISPECIES: hypothetical protein [Staphylococcus]|uniref:Uncharacterized protein n=1 Tax=Staphylococcus hsinchuensis TaxID=3051183 RepID=A0ABZ3EC98_9STAP|nr:MULTISPECIES: hypothetical protein [unclassified Staphylococcus]
MDKDNKRPLTLHEKWILDGEAIKNAAPGKYDEGLSDEEFQDFSNRLEKLKSDREKKGYE